MELDKIMESNKSNRDKKKEEKNLIWIEQPVKDKKGNTNALEIGFDVWEMYNKEFNLSISDIANILKCERKWVLNYVKDNVKHIFLNNNFRSFLNSLERVHHLNRVYPETYLKDYYYFSKNDFFKWLQDNTVITRQTIKVNLENFVPRNDRIEYKNILEKYHKERDKLLKNSPSKTELVILKDRFVMRLQSFLNEGGKRIYGNNVNVQKRNLSNIDVTNREDLPSDFITIKELKGEKSLELAYRSLYENGALKYTIAGSLVRYDEDYLKKSSITGDLIFTIPYELFLKNEKYYIV